MLNLQVVFRFRIETDPEIWGPELSAEHAQTSEYTFDINISDFC